MVNSATKLSYQLILAITFAVGARAAASFYDGKTILLIVGHDPAAITRHYAVTPGTLEDRIHLLRKGFMDTLKDPEFIADAKCSRLVTDPLTGEEIEKIVL